MGSEKVGGADLDRIESPKETIIDMERNEKKNKQVMDGVVINNNNDKTVAVRVNRFTKHPKYQKFMKISKKILAHNEIDGVETGQRVRIESCRPISKRKSFRIVEKI